jgi:hypothetical protein
VYNSIRGWSSVAERSFLIISAARIDNVRPSRSVGAASTEVKCEATSRAANVVLINDISERCVFLER